MDRLNYYQQITNKNIDKERAKKELIEILSNRDIIPFIKNFFRKISVDFMDKEGKEFFKDHMLKFIFDNELKNNQGNKKRYSYVKVKTYLESTYPQDPMSDILIMDNSQMSPSFYRRHTNQRHYNRRRITNRYFSFIKTVFLKNRDLIIKELGFTVECYLGVLDQLLISEIRIHSMSESDLESYFINEKEIYVINFENHEISKVIEFLCSLNTSYKLYKIRDLLIASDYSMLYDNMFSIIVGRLKDRKSSFGNNLGKMFEVELFNLFSSQYKTYSNCFIDNQEIDLVCLFGDVILIIEAKARFYSIDSMEDERNRNNARKKVEHAVTQLEKRVESLYNGKPVLDSEGNVIADRNTTSMVIPIVVTLEDLFELNNITSDVATKRKLEFLAFTISLDELSGIFENMASPYQFVNYVYYRNMKMMFNKHHFHLDKFADFIIRNKKVSHLDRYGVHLQYKIRDYFAVNRVLASWGKEKHYGFEDRISLELSELLCDISISKYSSINSQLTILINYFLDYTNIELIINRSLFLNKIDEKGKGIKEEWIISTNEKHSSCDYLILLESESNKFKKIITMVR